MQELLSSVSSRKKEKLASEWRADFEASGTNFVQQVWCKKE